MNTSIKIVTDATFEKEVLGHEGTIIVDFWGQDCRPCHALAPIYAQVAEENVSDTVFAKLDADENPEAWAASQTLSIPTLNVYQNGVIVKQVRGAMPKTTLLAELAEYL